MYCLQVYEEYFKLAENAIQSEMHTLNPYTASKLWDNT